MYSKHQSAKGRSPRAASHARANAFAAASAPSPRIAVARNSSSGCRNLGPLTTCESWWSTQRTRIAGNANPTAIPATSDHMLPRMMHSGWLGPFEFSERR